MVVQVVGWVLGGQVVGGALDRGQGGRGHRGPVVVLHVQHVGKEGLGGGLQLLHLVLYLDRFKGNFLARSGHSQEPGDPLKEDGSHLDRINQYSQRNMVISCRTYPVGHVVSVCLPVVVVEDHDSGDHTGGNHEHDAVEVGPWTRMGSGHWTSQPARNRKQQQTLRRSGLILIL